MGTAEALMQSPGFAWAMLLVVAALAFRRKAIAAGLVSLTGAAFLWLVGATPVPARLLASLERPYERLASSPLPNADAVLMLGGAVGYTRREVTWFGLGEASDRMLASAEMVRRGHARVLVLSGSTYVWEGQRRPDAELVAGWLRSWKLPAAETIVLPAAVNTHDEAVNMAALLRTRGWRRVVLVSSAYHLRRSVAVFRKAGVEVTPLGCDFLGLAALDSPDPGWRIVPRPDVARLFRIWLHEQLGLLWYWWKGWI